ncbi:AAA family ATPase [Picosynechococcus sp. PCC 7003]|uniref:sigma 54-interacting transcriptional regulator n=1 Tax=Picosynechococcus sp. PCC 7003 TaxID=374981 RepID=UPI000810CF71|nr:sigma 54-interacting transcriptional regulator [Picosynechococcus sp. PCC 7003]ANV84240.1 AAA family ATPase [Picosynechococcus sp. PCC 7003]
MTIQERLIWLQERTSLGCLSMETLGAIAAALQRQTLPPQQALSEIGQAPQGLYILISGEVVCHNAEAAPETNSLTRGSTVNLRSLLLNEAAQEAIATVTETEVWFMPRQQWQDIIQNYPEITQAFSQDLAQELAEVAQALQQEQQQQEILRPYLVTKAKRGVVGKSRYAKRLRQQIREAGTHDRSIYIFGEPGLEKDNLAALIHYGSPRRRQPIIKIDCSILQKSGAELFGRTDGKKGLLEWLGKGTLILNKIEELPPELIDKVATLIETQTYTPISRPGDPEPVPQQTAAKLVAIAERQLPAVARHFSETIKVPPLRVRKADLAAQVEYYTSLFCRAKGLDKPTLTPEALRRLQSYDFPNNIRELQNLVERAIVQSDQGSMLTEEIFWSAQGKQKRFRLNLLNAYPTFRRFLRSPWWPDRINYGFTAIAFPLIIAVLFLAPQTRDQNFALNFFWAWWWPLVLLAFPFVGRLWCAVCPFMIYGEITQKITTELLKRDLKPWPRQQAEKWGGWFLFGLFALIFLWEELWDLQNTAYLSAWLLIIITAGAMICSAIFERRFWCRYLCPIGGMNGLFAKLSMTELRAQQGTCSAECSTYQCYKGGPQKGEGLETAGCPLYSHPAQLEDNRDCVLCMTCLKACPHRSVAVNLRPPAIELWTTHQPRAYEVALLLLLLGGIFLHRLPEINQVLGLNVDLSQFWPHLGLAIAALGIPAGLVLLTGAAVQFLNSPPKAKPFLQLAYGYLPLVLGGSLAHYLRLGLGEAGQILPVTMATFGLQGSTLPIVVAHPAVIAFLQGSTLIFGTLCTFVLTKKISKQAWRSLLPQYLTSLGLTWAMAQIIVGL